MVFSKLILQLQFCSMEPGNEVWPSPLTSDSFFFISRWCCLNCLSSSARWDSTSNVRRSILAVALQSSLSLSSTSCLREESLALLRVLADRSSCTCDMKPEMASCLCVGSGREGACTSMPRAVMCIHYVSVPCLHSASSRVSWWLPQHPPSPSCGPSAGGQYTIA